MLGDIEKERRKGVAIDKLDGQTGRVWFQAHSIERNGRIHIAQNGRHIHLLQAVAGVLQQLLQGV